MSSVAAKHLSLIVTAIVLAGAPALAQTPQERAWCEGEDAVSVDQRIDGCSAVIKAARDRGDKLAEIFNNRGIAYRLKGEYDRAIQDYSQAIKLNAKFAAAYNNRGVVYDRKGEYDRAIADYDQAIRIDPGYANAFNARGFALREKGDLDRAIADFDRAISLNPRYFIAISNRGSAWRCSRSKCPKISWSSACCAPKRASMRVACARGSSRAKTGHSSRKRRACSAICPSSSTTRRASR